jgi:hypothetical protein
MKIEYILIVILNIIGLSTFSQTKECDSVLPKYELPVFTAAACLEDVLIATVEADSNNTRYPPEVFFYELDYQESKNIPSIWITPARWKKVLSDDYTGIIKIGKMMFLCRGKIKTDPLFSNTGKREEVMLSSPEIYKEDSIDFKTEMGLRRPSLQGVYVSCEGRRINLTIVAARKLNDFETRKNAEP